MDTFAELVPDGTAPPPEIPAAIFDAASKAFLEARRLDMQALAAEVGTSRATLYRRVGDRDKLLGAVLWWFTRHAIARAVDYAERRRGGRRVVSILDRYMHDIHSQAPLRRFLDAEPEAALRILTSKRGPVQAGLIEVVQRLLEEEHERGNLELKMDAETLAYIIVRVGESFLYADVIAAGEPDVDRGIEVVSQLLDVTYGPR